MNADQAKILGLVKDANEFEPGTWVRVFWGNGDRQHQYTRFFDKSTIDYLTQWPSKGSYYRLATEEEIKAGKISEVKSIMEDAQDEFRSKQVINTEAIKSAMRLLKEILE